MSSKRTGRPAGKGAVLIFLLGLFLISAVLGPRPAKAAVGVLDSFPATPQINSVTSSPQSVAYTPSVGPDRLIVIEVTNIPGNTTVTTIAVTYGSNNVPATAVVNSANNQRRQAWLFYLTEADISAAADNTLTVTNNNAAGGFSVNIATFSGVDQSAPVTASGGQYVNNTAAVLNYPAALNVNAGGYGIIAASCNTTGGTIGESYTDHGETTVGAGFSRLGSKAIASAGTTNPGVTYGANVRGGVAGMTLNPAPAGSPGSLQFTSAAYSVNESGGSVTITATRTGGSSGAVGVSYATANGTAAAGSDYTAAGGTLSWADGDTADKTFTVTVLNDAAVEGNETFTVSLSGPTGGATLGSPGSGTVTINDDDVASSGTVQLSSSSYSVNENGGTVTITATRTGGSNGAVGVSYATANGTAAAGSDYTAAGGTLSWADGDTADKTFTVTVLNDAAVEGNETFTVSLSGPTGGATLGSPGSGTVTIVDDEGAPAQVPAGNAVLFAMLAGGMAYFAMRKRKTSSS